VTASRAEHARAVPRVGWLLACSLWLLPVVFGFGMTSWIGFAVIGLLVMRIRWVLLAIGWLVVLAWIGVGPDGLSTFLDGLVRGRLDPGFAGAVLLLYLGGVVYGVKANLVWLQILHDRRVRGVPMLGFPRSAPAEATVAPDAAAPAPDGSAPASEDERAELLAQTAEAFSARLAQGEQDAPPSFPTPVAAPASSAPAPSTAPRATALPAPTMLPSTLLGLPSGPVDVQTASLAELAAIPAIGPERAARLVAARQARRLTSLEDVVEVLDLTAVDLVRARSYLRF